MCSRTRIVAERIAPGGRLESDREVKGEEVAGVVVEAAATGTVDMGDCPRAVWRGMALPISGSGTPRGREGRGLSGGQMMWTFSFLRALSSDWDMGGCWEEEEEEAWKGSLRSAGIGVGANVTFGRDRWNKRLARDMVLERVLAAPDAPVGLLLLRYMFRKSVREDCCGSRMGSLIWRLVFLRLRHQNMAKMIAASTKTPGIMPATKYLASLEWLTLEELAGREATLVSLVLLGELELDVVGSSGTSLVLFSIRQKGSLTLSTHSNPSGQQASPHLGRDIGKSAVWRLDMGNLSASCNAISQEIRWILLHVDPTGQQSMLSLPTFCKGRHSDLMGQHQLAGYAMPHVEKSFGHCDESCRVIRR